MNMENFKPSWKHFLQHNNAVGISEEEILDIIEKHSKQSLQLFPERILRNAAIFSFLITFCQSC